MKTAFCLHCGKIYPTEEMVYRKQTMEKFHVCCYCKTKRKRDRFIKPDVVLFGDTGDWFSMEGFNTIIQLIEQADCMP
jgi:NAD-dependent deacetylase